MNSIVVNTTVEINGVKFDIEITGIGNETAVKNNMEVILTALENTEKENKNFDSSIIE